MHIVRANVPVAVFSLEMSKEQLVNRVLCSEAMVDSNKVRTGKLEENDWTNLLELLDHFQKRRFILMIHQE